MNKEDRQKADFIYTFAWSKEEEPLCLLERRMLFREHSSDPVIKTKIEVDPSRSPFIKERIEVLYKEKSLNEIYQQAGKLDMKDQTYKVLFVKTHHLDRSKHITFDERRSIEREIGQRIKGSPDLTNPQQIIAVVPFEGEWYLGLYMKSKPVWMHHMKKPREYSTALSTRMARAIVNIAVPNVPNIRLIDPCCGIGTVLVEALSMGINVVGRDMNPLVCVGSRENVAHFGYSCVVTKGKIEDETEHYDTAIVDLPYDLCTTATVEDQQSIINHTRRIASRAVIVSSEPIDKLITKAGLEIIDRCEAKKGNFLRQILVCKRKD